MYAVGVLYKSKKNGNPELIPIPGASSASRVKENGKVVTLSDGDVQKIDEILEGFDVAGTRYPAQMMGGLNA
jgi:pyridoxine 4-dehydrogenase